MTASLSTQVAVELTRFRSRRTVRLVAVICLLLGVVLAAKTAYDSRPFSPTEIATARAQAAMAAEAKRSDVAECIASPTTMLGAGATARDCREDLLAQTSDFLTRAPLRLRVVVDNNGLHLAIVMLALLVIAGAGAAGSDWASGSIRNQVLVQARRARLWGAKALAVALGSLAIAAVTLAVFWIPLRVIAAERGLTVTAGGLVVGHVIRTLVIATVAPVVGFALAMLFRSTLAAVGLVFGVGLAAEILLGPLPVPGTGRLVPSNNLIAWLSGNTRYFDPSLRCGSSDCQIRVLTMWPAGLLMLVVAVVLVTLSWADFRRRDIP